MSPVALKFLVDVGVGKGVEEFLQARGYDNRPIRSIDPRMDDLDIVRLAHAEDRVVVTMDKDFGELVYQARSPDLPKPLRLHKEVGTTFLVGQTRKPSRATLR